MDVAIYANHAEPEIAAIAGKFTADGGRVYWRSPTHYTAGESEKMDLVLTAPNHPHAEQIARSALLQVLFCNIETVIRFFQDFQPLWLLRPCIPAVQENAI